MSTERYNKILSELNEILDSKWAGSKDKTLAYQRGLLMGWIARIALEDMNVRREIRDRANQAKKQKP